MNQNYLKIINEMVYKKTSSLYTIFVRFFADFYGLMIRQYAEK